MSAAEMVIDATVTVIEPNMPTLSDLESVIEAGLQSFVDVGSALLKIKMDKRYREAGYSSFEAYCTGRWGIGRSRGYQLVTAAATFEALAKSATETSTAVDVLPTAERQVRPLSSLPPSVQRSAWDRAVAEAGDDQPTAEQVEVAVETVLAENKKPTGAAPPPPVKPARQRPITKTGLRLEFDIAAMARRISKFRADDRVRRNRHSMKELSRAISDLVLELNELECMLTFDDDRYDEMVWRDEQRQTEVSS